MTDEPVFKDGPKGLGAFVPLSILTVIIDYFNVRHEYACYRKPVGHWN